MKRALAMQAIAEVQIVPIGVGVSMRNEVMRACELLREAGLRVHMHATGTDVEGSLPQILEAVHRMHATLHREGVPRLTTNVRLDTRVDQQPAPPTGGLATGRSEPATLAERSAGSS